jgi:hypothetical protein
MGSEVLFYVLLAVLVGGGLFYGLKAHARALLGPVRLEVSPDGAELGRSLEVKLAISPTGKLEINSVRLGVRGYEWIRWTETETTTDSDGKRSTRTVTRTRTQDFFHESKRLGARTVSQGAGIDTTFRCTVPREGPPSFAASDNAIKWEAYVELDIAGLPDVREETSFTVAPRLVPAEEVSHG